MPEARETTKGADFRAPYLCPDSEATLAFGRVLAPCLRGGDRVCLSGEMGAGKTCLSRGIAEGLGFADAGRSPSFNLLVEYEPPHQGGLGLCHFDAWRLHSAEEWFELGFHEYPSSEQIALIEWPERVWEALAAPTLVVRIETIEGGLSSGRLIRLQAGDGLTKERRREIAAALEEFLC